MQSVSITQLDTYFAKLLKTIPDHRRAMFEELADEMLKDVKQRIGGAGKVQSWQDRYTGSGGGYAAVRAKAKTYTDTSPRYAVGYVTNAIENGHIVGKRGSKLDVSNMSWRELTAYRRARKMMSSSGKWVPSKHFYADARKHSTALAKRVIAEFERKLKEELK